MRPQRIVILGGTGFVGRALTSKLAQKRHDLLVLSRNQAMHREAPLQGGVKLIDVDVYDENELARVLAGANVAINLVGILNEPGRGGAGFRKAHVTLTQTLIRACERAHVPRLLQMSALNAGAGDSHYLKTRGEAEMLVRASPLAWTIFRPSVMFGPGDGLFARFGALLGLMPVLPLAQPNARFAPVFVGDVAEAMVRALEDDASISQTYELGGPRVMTLREIVAYTAEQLGVSRAVIPLPGVLGRLQATAMDFVPGKPFSTDNYLSLAVDSIPKHDGLAELGIKPTPVEAVVPNYLGRQQQKTYDRYRSSRER